MTPSASDMLVEEVGLVFGASSHLLRGQGGIKQSQVALARRVCYWVLARQDVPVPLIAVLFSRQWQTVVLGLRLIDRQLLQGEAPPWAPDIFVLAGVSTDALVSGILARLSATDAANVRAYLALLAIPSPPASVAALDGLRLLAVRIGLRRRLCAAYRSTGALDPEWLIRYDARHLGYPLEG